MVDVATATILVGDGEVVRFIVSWYLFSSKAKSYTLYIHVGLILMDGSSLWALYGL
jgi:hypothetical protein